jgi:hypothetical protein
LDSSCLTLDLLARLNKRRDAFSRRRSADEAGGFEPVG